MKYAITFLALAMVLAYACFSVPLWLVLPVAWVALSFGLLGLAYAGLGPKLFLKRADGTLGTLSFILFGPVHLLNWCGLRQFHWTEGGKYWIEAGPNLLLGCRLPESAADRLAETNLALVVDLAAELPEVRALRSRAGYLSVPVLDTHPPSAAGFAELVARIQQARTTGPVYVHCALGHGRSATVVIGCLLAGGEFASAEEAEAFLRSKRRGVKLTPSQKRLLEKYHTLAQAPLQF